MMEFDKDVFFQELEKLVNIDSGSNSPEGILEVAEFLKNKYKELGMNTRIISHADADCCLEARNFTEGEADIMLVGHMDTVFPEGTVKERPYRTDDLYAYGPGVADMKAGTLMISYLVKRWKETVPGIKILVAHNGDEETGSEHSKEWLRKLAEKARYCLVLEPGRPDGEFVKGRKGCVDILLKMRGIASHAGNAPEKGASAIVALSHWIRELYALNDLTVGRLINPGVISGGTAPNVVADYAECRFDVRFSTIKDIEIVREAFRRLAAEEVVPGVNAEWEEIGYCSPMVVSKGSEKMIEIIKESAGELGITTDFINVGGSSDANNISEAGTPVLCGCGPCGTNLHSDKEYMVLKSVPERYELLGIAVEKLLCAPEENKMMSV